MSQKLSPAAVVIGVLRAKIQFNPAFDSRGLCHLKMVAIMASMNIGIELVYQF